MAKQFINSTHKMKGIAAIDLAVVLDRLEAISQIAEFENDDADIAADILDIAKYLKDNSSDLTEEKEKDGCIYNVVQVLVKGDDYEIACPDNEDTWYDSDDIACSTEQEALEKMIGEHKLQLLNNGEIDYVVFRGDW